MKKIIILIVCVCTVLAFSVLAYFIFIHHSVADYLKIAQTAMKAGDLKKAESNFIKVIRRDKANEEAYKALAEIAEKNNNPALAASYWGISAKLNPLSKEIAGKYLSAMLDAYQYPGIIKVLNGKSPDELSDFELYALTRASYYQNSLRETKRLLEILLKRSPTNPQVILLHAKILQAENNPQKAAEVLRSLINSKDKKTQATALTDLGQCLQTMKKMKEAGKYFHEAVKVSPDSVDARMALGEYNLSIGKYKIAEAQYIKMHKDFPDNLFVTITLAEILTQKKDGAGIKKLLNHIKAKSRAAIAVKYYLRALLAYLENNPDELKTNLSFCKIFQFRPLYAYLKLPEIMQSNNISLIERYISGLRQINNSKTARKELCYQLERQALINFKKKDFAKAAALGQILEKFDPSNPAFVHLTMVCVFKNKRWHEAVKAADRFNKLRPDTLDYLKIKGCSLLFLEKTEEALPLLEKLIKIDSGNPDVWLCSIQAFQKTGNAERLDQSIDKLLKLPITPKSEVAINDAASLLIAGDSQEAASKMAEKLLTFKNKNLQALAWSIKAQIAEKNKKWQEAVESMKKSCQLAENIDRLLYISDLYAENNDYGKALDYIAKALDKEPENLKAFYRKGVIYQNLKDYDKAEKIYRKLLEKYPDWSLVLVNLSDILSIKDNPQEALKLAWHAHEKSPLWPPAQFCLASREMECKNYSSAIRIFKLLQVDAPDNQTLKNLIAKCLILLATKDIEERSFTTAKLRLKELNEIKPGLQEISVLEKKLNAAVKAEQAPSPKTE